MTVHYQSWSRAALLSSGASAKETDRRLYLCNKHVPVGDFFLILFVFLSTRPEVCSAHSCLKSLEGFKMKVFYCLCSARWVTGLEQTQGERQRRISLIFVAFDLVTWPVGARKGWREWKLVGGVGAHGFQQKYIPLDWAKPLREHGGVFPVIY